VCLISGSSPLQSASAEVIVTVAGDTYAKVQSRTNAPPGGILSASSGAPVAAGAPLAPGTRLRVPGIHWVYSLASDTLGSIVRQHNVPLAELASANLLSVGAGPGFSFSQGSRVLIPIHRVLQ
jgi:LysM repeat protein